MTGTSRANRWHRAEPVALAATIPAFYLALLQGPRSVATLLYLTASLASATVLVHAMSTTRPRGSSRVRGWMRHQISLALVAGLMLSAFLPAGDDFGVLVIRLATSLLAVLRVCESLRPWFWREELPKFLTLAIFVLVLCGAGFWWLEPGAQTFGDGFWLAFTTAVTVGYGDIVPSTPASKIFAVFVCLMGVAVISLLTAAIAATWVQAEERKIEKEILQDLHLQLKAIRSDLESLRRSAAPDGGRPGPQARPRDPSLPDV